MIYLDNAATTKMFEEGADLYKKYACHSFFNPSAGYGEAGQVRKDLNNVRQIILNKLDASQGDIIFTGGATESNNLAIMGSRRNGKTEYIFSVGSHPSVYNVARELEKLGFVVHYVGLQKNGQIDYSQLEKLLNERTRLISIEHVSNETGAINDLKKIAQLREKFSPKALLHIDGVQAFCKIKVSLDNIHGDFYTMSAHKFHGPKGVGALYVRNINNLKSIVFGGGQEDGYRSGTENVGGIMAMGLAVNKIDNEKDFDYVQSLKEKMVAVLSKDNHVHVSEYDGSPYILSVWFENVNGETLMRAVADKGVIVGTGSACSSKKAGNRVLENLGFVKEQIKSHLRISFCAHLKIEEIEKAGEILLATYNEIREKVL